MVIAGCAGTALAATALPAGASGTSSAAVGHYAALGDSFSSGPGIPTQTDPVCGRSDHNYPTLLASALASASSTDVTCAGAETKHITQAQDAAGPQIDAVRPDSAVVTVGVGGNDLDLAGIIKRCVLLASLNPQGSPCKKSYSLLGTDEIGSRINTTGPKVAAVLRAVRGKAPQARTFLVGYPALVPDDGSACRSTVPLAAGDFPWLRDKTRQLNSVLAQQAAVTGATFVDTYTPSMGHDACKPAGTRWIEPTDTAAAAGFHPNAAHHRSTAAALTALLTN